MFILQTFYTEMTNLLQVTINIRKFHRHPHWIAIRVRRRCVFRLSWSSRSFMHRRRERAIRLVYPPSFCKLRSSSNPPKHKNLTDSISQMQTAVIPYTFRMPRKLIWTILVTMTDTAVSRNIYFPSGITLYETETLQIFKNFCRLKVIQFSSTIGHMRKEQSPISFS
jgi:hypothetical protein